MKPLIALLLSVLMLASSLLPRHDLAELSRLPRLLEHFRQHQQANGALSFGQFLALHYGATGRQTHRGAHPREHEGLPLHDCHHSPVPALCVQPVVVLASPGPGPAWPARAYRALAGCRYPGGHALARWQPPCA